MKDNLTVGFVALAVIALLVVGPILTIWALNTLFPVLAIPYSIYTWLAVVILASVFKTNIHTKR